MKVLISGSTGLVGSALAHALTNEGHETARLVRQSIASSSTEIAWNPADGTIDGKAIEGCDAVVHLAGANIASGRWTRRRKAIIRDSRVLGTRLLCETLAKLHRPPAVLVCASAIGYYGARGDEALDEDRGAGSGFLAELCRDWESATEPARAAAIRVVNLRMGMILTGAGGALAAMMLPFKLGLGGVVGSGRQYWSWVAIDDVVGAIQRALTTTELSGPVNCVAPTAVTNRDFTKTLGKFLRRPTLLPMPAFAARILFGGMADGLLLASARVVPKRLLESGYEFRYPDLDETLKHVLTQ